MLALVPGARLVACCDPIDLARAKVRDRRLHTQKKCVAFLELFFPQHAAHDRAFD